MFGAFLGMLVELGYGIAYRVLDAQYFGVPQRRRRVFVIGHLGGWRGPAAVLLERHSLSGYPPPRRETRQGAAGGVEVGPSGGRFTNTAPTIDAGCKDGFIRNQLGIGVLSPTDESETRIAHALSAGGFDASEDGTGRGTPVVPVAICTAHTQSNGSGFSESIAHTLESGGGAQTVAFAQNTRDEVGLYDGDGKTAGALAARDSRMERDLSFLREKGLITVDAVNARRDGRGGRVERIEVVTLTKAGRDVARQTSELPQNQKLYSGLVKPREAEHDAQIYRAYRKEAESIEQKGGINLRVQLDFELKSEVQKAIHAARKADPDRGMTQIKLQVAQQFELPYINDGIQIPDARIQYEMDQGSRTGHEDIEVLTAAYRSGHLRAKAQAGFRAYASPSDRASLSAKIEDDHRLMENILEL
jgi:hypothetical protein